MIYKFTDQIIHTGEKKKINKNLAIQSFDILLDFS